MKNTQFLPLWSAWSSERRGYFPIAGQWWSYELNDTEYRRGLTDSLWGHYLLPLTLPRSPLPQRTFKRWSFDSWSFRHQTSREDIFAEDSHMLRPALSQREKEPQHSASCIRYIILCNSPNSCMRRVLLLPPNKWGNRSTRSVLVRIQTIIYLISKVPFPTMSNSIPQSCIITHILIVEDSTYIATLT